MVTASAAIAAISLFASFIAPSTYPVAWRAVLQRPEPRAMYWAFLVAASENAVIIAIVASIVAALRPILIFKAPTAVQTWTTALVGASHIAPPWPIWINARPAIMRR